MLTAVAELDLTALDGWIAIRQTAHHGIMGYRPKADNDLRLQLGNLIGQETRTGLHFLQGGFVSWGQAFHGIGQPAIDQPLIIVSRDRLRPRRKSVCMKGSIEQIAAPIARKRPAGRIRSVHAWGKAHHHNLRCITAKWRHRPANVARVLRVHRIQKGR
jgi:hypothetical protein